MGSVTGPGLVLVLQLLHLRLQLGGDSEDTETNMVTCSQQRDKVLIGMSQASVSACYTLQPINSPLQFWNVIVGIQKFVLCWHQVVLQVQQLLKHWIERLNMFQSNQITKISCFSSSKRSVTFIPSCSFIRESYSLSSCRHKTETFIIISVVKCKTDAQTELFLTHSFTFFISNSFHQGPSEKWNFRGQR